MRYKLGMAIEATHGGPDRDEDRGDGAGHHGSPAAEEA